MKPHMQRPFTATPARQRGAVMVLVVIALASMLLMGALALDGGHMLLNKTRLQNAVDAAALSGAKTLQQVTDSGNSSSLTRDAALNTLRLNANADGNGELSDGIGSDGVGAFAVVELSNSVYGPFSYPGPADAAYVRVTVPDYPLVGFLWNVVNMFSSGDLEKAVAAIATAGPSPTTTTCNIDPIVVCGNPDQYDPGLPDDPYDGVFWGYQFGQLVTLTCGTPGIPSAGNCQLLRLGDDPGGAVIRQAFCAGTGQCLDDTRRVNTEPGITWGPVAQGLNTRLGIYNGPVDPATCPPDLYTDYSQPLVVMDGETPMYQDVEVTSDDGDLSTDAADVLDIKDWQEASKACASGSCDGRVRGRRILNVVIGDCSTTESGGATSLEVLGVGCFYLLQRVEQSGDKQVLGQFMKECEGSGSAGVTPADDVGPNIIQLYKTYIGEGVGVPSPDS